MIKILGLLSPVIVPLILSLLLALSSKRNDRAKLYLAAYMLLISFVFLANLFYFQHNYRIYSYLHSLHIASVLAIYPGAYIYVQFLINPGITTRKLLLHFLPSVFFLFASASIFFPALSPDERVLFLEEYRFEPDFTKPWMKILYYVRMANILTLFIQVFLYLFLTIRSLKKHREHMSKIFSNPEKFNLNWLGFFNLGLAIAAFVSVFLYTVNPAKLFGDERFLAYPLLLIALILWFLGIMGNNQEDLPEIPFETKDDNAKNNLEFSSSLKEKILAHFEKDKPYLDPGMKIWDLARELGTNRTYISQVINKEFNMNFSVFVNHYRVKEIELILKENARISGQELAEKVGFGSLSSLNRAIADTKGCKLSTLRKRYQLHDHLSGSSCDFIRII